MSQIMRSLIASVSVFVLIVIVSLVPVQAQTQASCTFTYFSIPSPYNVSVEPNGINHYNTVVGQANNTSRWKGFIRFQCLRVAACDSIAVNLHSMAKLILDVATRDNPL